MWTNHQQPNRLVRMRSRRAGGQRQGRAVRTFLAAILCMCTHVSRRTQSTWKGWMIHTGIRCNNRNVNTRMPHVRQISVWNELAYVLQRWTVVVEDIVSAPLCQALTDIHRILNSRKQLLAVLDGSICRSCSPSVVLQRNSIEERFCRWYVPMAPPRGLSTPRALKLKYIKTNVRQRDPN